MAGSGASSQARLNHVGVGMALLDAWRRRPRARIPHPLRRPLLPSLSRPRYPTAANATLAFPRATTPLAVSYRRHDSNPTGGIVPWETLHDLPELASQKKNENIVAATRKIARFSSVSIGRDSDIACTF